MLPWAEAGNHPQGPLLTHHTVGLARSCLAVGKQRHIGHKPGIEGNKIQTIGSETTRKSFVENKIKKNWVAKYMNGDMYLFQAKNLSFNATTAKLRLNL